MVMLFFLSPCETAGNCLSESVQGSFSLEGKTHVDSLLIKPAIICYTHPLYIFFFLQLVVLTITFIKCINKDLYKFRRENKGLNQNRRLWSNRSDNKQSIRQSGNLFTF